MYVHMLQEWCNQNKLPKRNTDIFKRFFTGQEKQFLQERRNRIRQSLKWKACNTVVVWR